MTTSDFQKIGTFANPAQADQIRAILEEHGIPAFVDGANSGTMLNHIGTALGGVGVLVRGEDTQQALEVLESLEEATTGDAWFCGACQEEIDAGFQVCWSCGEPRSEVEAPFPEKPEIAEPIPETQPTYPREKGPVFAFSPEEWQNPFASPQVKSQATDTPEPPRPIDPEAEAMLLRAWRASILGLIFLPILAHLYAMYLLIAALRRTSTFSAEGDRRFYGTFAVCVLGCAVWGLAFRAMLS